VETNAETANTDLSVRCAADAFMYVGPISRPTNLPVSIAHYSYHRVCCFYTARYLAAAQCIVIGPVCVFACLQRAGGRAGGVRTLLQPARAVFASLWALFH